jgi:cobalt/nickel transport protein
MKTTTKLWVGLAVLVVLSPLGLILPDHFKAGSAWGEWGVDEISKLVGYVPGGFAKLSNFWNAPMPDYAFKNPKKKNLPRLNFGYIFSAIIGTAVIVAVIILFGKMLAGKDKQIK